MQQRIIRPALFALLLLCIAFLAAYSDRGASILSSPYHLGVLADYAGSMPFISACMTVLASFAAMFFFLVPDADTIVLLVSSLGFYSGTFTASLELCLAGGLACLITRYFLHDSIRAWMIMRRRSHRPALPGAQLPLEYCLLATAVLLCCSAPAVAAGFVLGIAGMRPKAFCLASYPFLAAKAVITGYSVVPASWYGLIFTAILGTVIAIAYLVWLLALVRKMRLSEKAREKDPAPAPSVVREQKLMDIDIDEPVNVPAPQNRDAVSLSDALLVLISEKGSDKASEAILKAAGALGIRTHACRLAGAANFFRPENAARQDAMPQDSVPDGVRTAADLDVIFATAFRQGYGKVLCIRPVSALVRADLLQEALYALEEGCGLVLGRCAEAYYLIGASQHCGHNTYEDGLLKGMDFSSDVAFAMAGFAMHPKMLPELPPAEALSPLASVIVLAENAKPTLVQTVRHALDVPCAECIVVTSESADPVMRQAEAMGASVLPVKESLVASLNEAADLAHGRYLVLMREGIELPQDFDKAVWDSMRLEKCMAGGFSTSSAVPGVRRTARWLGSAVQAGRLSGPDMTQAVFMRKDDFLHFGGLEGTDPDKAVAALVTKLAKAGTVVIHNARVRFLHAMPGFEECGAGDDAKVSGAGWLVREVQKRLSAFFARSDDARVREQRQKGLARLQKQIDDMTAQCDHCGRCTHVSPMLHRHSLDLAELAKHPLLAWHCFMCGECTQACHKGIDGVALARLLRRQHVLAHAGRLARPGHALTLACAKFSPLYTKCALKGVSNVLLPASFCAAWPKTAMALGQLCRQHDLGVIVADTGAGLADLGLHDKAKAQADKLKAAMDSLGVTEIVTVSPHDQRWLTACGISCSPLAGLSDMLGFGTLSMEGRCLFVPCADRASKAFLRALAPLFRGTVREIDVPCCGAGGEASVLEPECAARLKKAVQTAAKTDRVLVYCPRCAETLKAAGVAADLDLSLLLGVAEKPVSGLRRISAFVSCLKGLSRLAVPTLAVPEVAPETVTEAMAEPAAEPVAEDQQVQDSVAGKAAENLPDDAGDAGQADAADDVVARNTAVQEEAAEVPESCKADDAEGAEGAEDGPSVQEADDAWCGLDDGASWDGEDEKAFAQEEEKTAAGGESNSPEPEADSETAVADDEPCEEPVDEKAPETDRKQDASRKAVSLDAYRE